MRSISNSRACDCCGAFMPAKKKRRTCSGRCGIVWTQTRSQEKGAARARERMKGKRNGGEA